MNLGFVSSGRTQYVHKQQRKKKKNITTFLHRAFLLRKKKDKFGFQGERRGVKVINLRAFLPF